MSPNPQITRTLFTELASHLQIDAEDHPSNILQEAIRKVEDLQRKYSTLQAKHDALQDQEYSTMIIATVSRIEALELRIETLRSEHDRLCTLLEDEDRSSENQSLTSQRLREEFKTLREDRMAMDERFTVSSESTCSESTSVTVREVLGGLMEGLVKEPDTTQRNTLGKRFPKQDQSINRISS